MAKVTLRCGKLVGVNSFCLLCKKHFIYSRKTLREAAQELIKKLRINLNDSDCKESVIVCQECINVANEFTKLLVEYEIIKLKLSASAHLVVNVINNSVESRVHKRKNAHYDDSAKTYADNLRTQVQNKVSAFLPIPTVKVQLERLPSKEQNVSLSVLVKKAAVVERIPDETGNNANIPGPSRHIPGSPILESQLAPETLNQEDQDFLNELLFPDKPTTWHKYSCPPPAKINLPASVSRSATVNSVTQINLEALYQNCLLNKKVEPRKRKIDPEWFLNKVKKLKELHASNNPLF